MSNKLVLRMARKRQQLAYDKSSERAKELFLGNLRDFIDVGCDCEDCREDDEDMGFVH